MEDTGTVFAPLFLYHHKVEILKKATLIFGRGAL